jgi:hypothetical protein
MTDKEKQAIEMFYGIKEPIRLYNKHFQKYYDYEEVVIGERVWLKFGDCAGHEYHVLDYIDLDPPKTAYDEFPKPNMGRDSEGYLYDHYDINEIDAWRYKYESQLKEMIEVKNGCE